MSKRDGRRRTVRRWTDGLWRRHRRASAAIGRRLAQQRGEEAWFSRHADILRRDLERHLEFGLSSEADAAGEASYNRRLDSLRAELADDERALQCRRAAIERLVMERGDQRLGYERAVAAGARAMHAAKARRKQSTKSKRRAT